MVVMPGGVDIHAHIAGPKVNAARRLAPEEHRGDVRPHGDHALGHRRHGPSTVRHRLPLRAARLHDRWSRRRRRRSPRGHVLSELRDTPMIDALFLLLMGNNVALFDLIRRDPARVRDAVAWWLQATGGYGVKLVNPGGVESWKHGNGNVTSLDDDVAGVTPRQVLDAITGRCTRSGCRTPSTSTATTSASRATGARRWTRCARSRAGGAPRAPPVPRLRRQPAGGRARGARSSPSTSARTRSSAPTSGR
jgi:formylmethanofuran dehydrogenase subunit A